MKLEKTLKEAVRLIGKQSHGRLPRPAYDFIRRYEPLLSVDAILVPERNKPSVLLLKRVKKVVAGGEYYSIGGRLGKNKNLTGAMRRIIKAETGLTVKISRENIIGFGTTMYKPSRKDWHANYSVFTPCLSFAVRVQEAKQLAKKLKIGHGNVGWKVFTRIQPEWDSYLTSTVARAWDFFY